MIGKTLSHYEIVAKLGSGGMGDVYRARDTKLQRDVAIKVLPGALAADAEKRGRFEREALAVAGLKHPNIVTIHDFGEDDGEHFLVMELVEGKMLGELIPPSGFPLERFLEIALPLADAVSAAHDRGITHRDLKPGNVMLDEAGRVKVLDFGLAKLLQTDVGPDASMTIPAEQAETRAGQIVGTAAYMSPEQAQGKAVDVRSDVFSLGIILHEMATGQKPFEGDSSISMISSILKDDPKSVTSLNVRLPRHLGRIVLHCLVKDPERRYQSAKELRNELEGLKNELDSGDLERAEAPPAPGKPTNRAQMVGGVAVAIVAVAASLWALRDRDPPTPSPAPTSAPHEAAVGVIGFQNLTDPADAENLGRMLMALVTTHLAESGGLAVVSMPRVLAAVQATKASGPSAAFDPTRAPEAARAAGVSHMVVGQVGRAGPQTFLTAELIDVATGRTLGSHHEEVRSTGELFSSASAIASHLGAMVPGAEVRPPRSEVDLARVLTSSPEAYRHYLAGELSLHERDFDNALVQLDLAIDADPTFALAYYRAAIAAWWNGHYDNGLSYLRRGRPHVERLPDRWKATYTAVLDYLAGEYERAHAALSALAMAGTDLPDVYYMLGEIETHFSKYADVVAATRHFERALEIDPTFRVVLFHLIDGYVLAHQIGKADRLLTRLLDEEPDAPSLLDALTSLHLAQGRHDEAVRTAERLLQLQPSSIFRPCIVFVVTGQPERTIELIDRKSETGTVSHSSYAWRGGANIYRGRFREAIDDLSRAIEGLQETAGIGMASVAAAYEIFVSDAFAVAGELDRAGESARTAARLDPMGSSPHYRLGRLQAMTGDLAAADATMAELRSVLERTESPQAPYWSVLLQAELLLARGRAENALSALAPVEVLPPEYRDSPLESHLRGRIHEALGDHAAAAAAYRECVTPLALGPFPNIVLWTETLYRLAVAEENAGDTVAARAHYEEFLRRWGDADVDLPQVSDARARLERLIG